MPARGNYAHLLAELGSLADGEICYALDQDKLYVREGSNLVDVSGSGGGGGAVDSVNGETGVVVLDASDVGALADTAGINALSDVDTGSAGHIPTDGQVLTWNQSMGHWMPADAAGGGGGGATMVVSATEPAEKSEGDMWYATDVGRSFVYTGSEWVDMSPVGSEPVTPDLQAVTDAGNTTTAGAEFGGTVIGSEVDLDAIGRAWDMKTDGNFATTLGGGGGFVISNPTNATPGTSGLIRLQGAIGGWGDSFKHPSGSAEVISLYPAVVPFYVQDATNILLGKATQGIA